MNTGNWFEKMEYSKSQIVARCISMFFVSLLIIALALSWQDAKDANVCTLESGWQDAQQNSSDLSHFTQDTETVYRKVEQVAPGSVLLLLTRNMFVDVYVDGEKVYTDERDIVPLMGHSTGSKWHVVEMPEKAGPCEIELVGTACYSNSDGCIVDAYFGDTLDAFRAVCKNRAFGFLLTLVWLCLGIVILVIYIVFHNHFHLEADFWYLGAATFFSALWCCMETGMWQFFFGHSQMVHFIGYLSLLSIPVLLGLLGESRLSGKWLRNVRIYTYIAEAVFVLTTCLHITGIMEFHYTVFLVHALLFASIPFAVEIVKVYSKDTFSDKHQTRTWVFMTALCAILVVGIIRYATGHFEDYALFARWALLFFLLILTNYQFANISMVLRRGVQSELQHELALTDHLTKFYNRSGFAEHSKEYEQILAANGALGVIQFDINNLKKVNDSQGHEKGDELICLASSGIYQSFGMSGKCYRMGGDEFLVVLVGEDAREKYEKGIADLLVYCGYANSMPERTFDVKIAYGFYMAKPGDTLTGVQEQADILMYQKKRQMKAEENT